MSTKIYCARCNKPVNNVLKAWDENLEEYLLVCEKCFKIIMSKNDGIAMADSFFAIFGMTRKKNNKKKNKKRERDVDDAIKNLEKMK